MGILNQIRAKWRLAPSTWLFEVHAPQVASSAEPGQFVAVDTDGASVALPLAGWDRSSGTVRIVVPQGAEAWDRIGGLAPPEALPELNGPMGDPVLVEREDGPVALAACEEWTAFLVPIAAALAWEGNRVFTAIGARSFERLMFVEELMLSSEKVRLSTDDGTSGRSGLVVRALDDLRRDLQGIARVLVAGPPPMLFSVAKFAESHGIPCETLPTPPIVRVPGQCAACPASGRKGEVTVEY